MGKAGRMVEILGFFLTDETELSKEVYKPTGGSFGSRKVAAGAGEWLLLISCQKEV
jgi:hypothetical protein